MLTPPVTDPQHRYNDLRLPTPIMATTNHLCLQGCLGLCAALVIAPPVTDPQLLHNHLRLPTPIMAAISHLCLQGCLGLLLL